MGEVRIREVAGGPEEALTAARAARERAHVPYSGFAVGAAILTRDGVVFGGCNIENASYPATICAERVAAGAAIAAGHRDLAVLAVVGPRGRPVAPCGTCRQFLSEFNRGMLVVSEGADGAPIVRALSELFPEPFGPADLSEA